MSTEQPTVAYFSMEIALESALPTYSGGLGVLAGDTLRSCADLGLAVTGVTLIHRKGYFRQSIGPDGAQQEVPDPWQPEQRLEPLEPRVEVTVEGRPVKLRAWRYRIVGSTGREVAVLLLDADLPENDAEARALTDHLYGGDERYRLAQEVVLGVGGVRMLRAAGLAPFDCHHLNEGHAALAIPELLAGARAERPAASAAELIDAVRARCVFTTHTPVPAGHDRFPAALVRRVLGPELRARLGELGVAGELNLTELALMGARFVNGVAMRHGEVSREMFPGHGIRSITNGVHPDTWAAPAIAALFDEHVPTWRSDPFQLRCITALDPAAVTAAHAASKRALLASVPQGIGGALDPAALCIGFGRRATAYKRPLLLLSDPERLARIARKQGPLLLVYGGKAHPRDQEGRRIVRELNRAAARSAGAVRVVFLPGYDMATCGRLVAGCDVWLNTPVPPQEASGTSGMKAALNGVPSLSMLDGWWVEGCIEGVTGWAIGEDGDGHGFEAAARDALHAAALYDKLENVVAPTFFSDPARFASIRQQSIAINASYFHSHRMALQYLYEAYRVSAGRTAPAGASADGTGRAARAAG